METVTPIASREQSVYTRTAPEVRRRARKMILRVGLGD
jgi:hypothetical protein